MIRRIINWFLASNELHRVAIQAAGNSYYPYRAQIKNEVRRRVKCVTAGYDQALQSALLRGDVERICGGGK
jgi:hypothetical protein